MIDLVNLDKEIFKTTFYLEKVIPKLRDAEMEYLKAKHNLDLVYAQIDSQIRANINGKKPTEKQIENQILQDPLYQQALQDYLNKKYKYLKLKSMKEILSQRYHTCLQVIELLKVKYYGEFDLEYLNERNEEIKKELSNINFENLTGFLEE